jgi:hypothetical protein
MRQIIHAACAGVHLCSAATRASSAHHFPRQADRNGLCFGVGFVVGLHAGFHGYLLDTRRKQLVSTFVAKVCISMRSRAALVRGRIRRWPRLTR